MNDRDKLNEIGKRMNLKGFHPFIAPDIECTVDECISGALKLLESMEKGEFEIINNIDEMADVYG